MLYYLTAGLLAAGCAVTQERALATLGAWRRLFAVTGAWVAFLLVVGLLDYRRWPSHETPLVSYLAIAAGAPLCSALAIAGARVAGRARAIEIAAGVLAFLGGGLACLLGSYTVAFMLLAWLGCCPL